MKTVVLLRIKSKFFRLILTKAELLALTAADFNFDKETVTINKSYQRLHGEGCDYLPKTKRAIAQSRCRSFSVRKCRSISVCCMA